MTRYNVGCSVADGLRIATDATPFVYTEPALFELGFDLANHLGAGVDLVAKIKQTTNDDLADLDVEEIGPILLLDLSFVDSATQDIIYQAKGYLNPDDNVTSSIVAIIEAMDDFSEVELTLGDDIADVIDLDFFNEFNSLGRNSAKAIVPSSPVPVLANPYIIITGQDIEPNDLYMQFYDDFGLFTDLLRVANKLNIDLWVELDPTLTLDQVYQIAEDLAPNDHHVRLLWSPLRSRPLGAVGLKGKKIARHAGGYVMAQLLRRRANTNIHGVPPLHEPIAGYNYPITFSGIEQRADVILDDVARKKLANLKVNVVQRIRYESGVRFVIGDCLTAYGDKTSVLKLTNASDVSMFIDNRIKAIIRRHLLKAMDTMIGDALTECTEFLDACTTKDRPLLVKSEEFSGFYDLTILPRQDRPYDAVAVKCRYRPQGAARAAYLETEVTK